MTTEQRDHRELSEAEKARDLARTTMYNIQATTPGSTKPAAIRNDWRRIAHILSLLLAVVVLALLVALGAAGGSRG